MLNCALNFVYGLFDEREKDKPPVERSVYIGITNDPNTRLENHLFGKDGSKLKNDWLQGLLLLQPSPIKMEILEIIYDGRKRTQEREKYWVQEYQRQGYRIINQRLLAKPPKVPKPKAARLQPPPLLKEIAPQDEESPVILYHPQVDPDDDLAWFEQDFLDSVRMFVETNIKRGYAPFDMKCHLDCYYAGMQFYLIDEQDSAELDRWHEQIEKNLSSYRYEIHAAQ